MSRQGDDGPFERLAEPVLERPGATRSTMMGYPCLRLSGDFFVAWDPHHEQLIVKLDEDTANSLIGQGRAEPFAPSGRRFREWVAVPKARRRSWPRMVDDAFDRAMLRAAQSSG